VSVLATIVLAVVPSFTQLSLAQAQSLVVVNSVDVQVATADVRSREAALEIARTGGIPHLTGDYALAPQAGPYDLSTVSQHFITVGADVSINDILAASDATRAAANDLLASQRNAESTVLAARENAVKLYFAALQAIALERFQNETVAGAQRDRDAAAERERAGDAPHLDVVRADVTLAQAHADLARARAARADAVDALASATGMDADSFVAIGGDAGVQTAKTLDEPAAVARALAQRPEITSLLATISARETDTTAARQTGLPTMTASGGFQKGVDSGVPVQGPAVGVHVDVPIAPSERAHVAAAEAQADRAKAQLVDERRTIALEVKSAIRDARADDVAELAAAQARDEASRALAAVELGYREGASSSLEVAQARQTFAQASVDALVSSYQRAQAYALLEVIVP
jgi:outer membrane protein TolC